MGEQPNNIRRSNLKRKEFKMGQMSWLHYLVTAGDKKNLVKFLDEKGFKRPEFAANQFLKAQEEIESDGMKKESGSPLSSQYKEKHINGEPTTADEHNKEWLNEKEGKS